MKKQTLLSLLGSSLLVFATPIALADSAPSNAMPMSGVLEKLQAQGYNVVKEVEFEDGSYEVKAMNTQGRMEKFNVNPQTGEIVNPPKDNKNSISALEAVKKVEAEGYHGIYKVETEGRKYEVKALDKDGKKVELKVDGSSGKITKK
jgi:uncharacterized membrane protein YkoI